MLAISMTWSFRQSVAMMDFSLALPRQTVWMH
ncbi:hypothetical protein XGA_0149 [Xanthomonas hortorum ATCC 19865]|nr:hypothetical protein XGA_0149 [Xanthomonas hortorum ATCC 19865]